jgi:hypothetical protein
MRLSVRGVRGDMAREGGLACCGGEMVKGGVGSASCWLLLWEWGGLGGRTGMARGKHPNKVWRHAGLRYHAHFERHLLLNLFLLGSHQLDIPQLGFAI